MRLKDQKNVKINNCALGFTNLKRKIGGIKINQYFIFILPLSIILNSGAGRLFD